MAKIMISKYNFQHRIKLGDTMCLVREGGRFYLVGAPDVHEDFEIDTYGHQVNFNEDELKVLNKAIDDMVSAAMICTGMAMMRIGAKHW